MVDFPGNEEDSRKLRRVLEQVQHFREQCIFYLYINITKFNKTKYKQ